MVTAGWLTASAGELNYYWLPVWLLYAVNSLPAAYLPAGRSKSLPCLRECLQMRFVSGAQSERPTGHAKCEISACGKWGLESNNLTHILYTHSQKIWTFTVCDMKGMNHSYSFSILFSSAASHWPNKGNFLFLHLQHNLLCLGRGEMLFCVGVFSPAAPAEGN